MDSFVSVYMIRLPLTILFFLRFIPLGQYTRYMETYLILNESLLSRTYRLKSDLACRNIINDIDLIFPHHEILKTKHSFVKKFMGVFALLTLPNALFTYVVKINEKMKEATLEVLVINSGDKNRVQLQRVAYKIMQSLGFFLTNAYK